MIGKKMSLQKAHSKALESKQRHEEKGKKYYSEKRKFLVEVR